MPYSYNFVKAINSTKLRTEIVTAGLPAPSYINTVNTDVSIWYGAELTTEQSSSLTAVVNAHVALTTAESLSIYLDQSVHPFIKNLINTFAAENIALGITQAGKTADVLGLFEKPFNIGAVHLVSLKGSFDTGSLYVSIAILQYVRNNPSEYTGLSPFVTDARLLAMKNSIETFLGLPLST